MKNQIIAVSIIVAAMYFGYSMGYSIWDVDLLFKWLFCFVTHTPPKNYVIVDVDNFWKESPIEPKIFGVCLQRGTDYLCMR